MDNHYHLPIETPDANLSKGMHQLNSVYTQMFNRTHEQVGYVFQELFIGAGALYCFKLYPNRNGAFYVRVAME